MKRRKVFVLIICLSFILFPKSYCQKKEVENSNKQTIQKLVPDSMECDVQPIYLHRADGEAGREVRLKFKGGLFIGKASIEVLCNGVKEIFSLETKKAIREYSVLLPADAGVSSSCEAQITFRAKKLNLSCKVTVPVKRQWTIFLYPHSHVDIGYTQPQDIVEKITVRNLRIGMELAKETKNYPDGAKYVWNPEAVWASENFLKQASPKQKQDYIDLVKAGQVGIDGNYAHLNTSVCSDEELVRSFNGALRLSKLTGTPVTSMVQIDVPGATWGLPLAAAMSGIKGIIAFPNGFDRMGGIHRYFERPFYWLSADGKHRILYIQGPRYDLGWVWKASNIRPEPYPKYENPSPGWIQDYPSVVDSIRTSNPSEHFIPLSYLLEQTDALEKADVPYDYFTMTWSMSDNSIIDADLPNAVKAWNEKYAYPKLVIASGKQIIDAYEKKFGNIIPERKGDLTEYWTDGLGTDALRTGYNRLSKERLTQTEILWSILNKSNKDAIAPIDSIYNSWRWVTLGSEHTWGYFNPEKPIAKKIEATKTMYFENAVASSKRLLNETLKPITVDKSNKVCAINTLSWSRTGLVTLSAMQSKGFKSVIDASNKPVLSQRLSTGEMVFLAKDIPALCSKTYQMAEKAASISKKLMAVGNTLENELIKVEVSSTTGDIISFIDKRSGKEMVNTKSPYALNSFRYLHGADPSNEASTATDVSIRIKENGAVLASLLIESKAEGCNKLTRELRIFAGQPQVEINNTIDKISTTQKEGIHFGFAFNVPNGTTRMDIPWGVMNPVTDQLPGSNKNWLACQRWIDVSNNDYGVTWAPIEASIVEFGDITANILGGANDPKYWKNEISDPKTILSWALNNHWHTNYPLEQGGIIPFHYAILPHQGYDPVTANRFGLEQDRPLIVTTVDKNPLDTSLVKIDNDKVFVSTIKPAEEGKETILRLRSMSDKAENVKLTFPSGAPSSVKICKIAENPDEEIKDDLSILPYGMVTLSIKW